MTRKILTGLVIGLAGALVIPAIGSALHNNDTVATGAATTAVTAATPALIEAPECAVKVSPVTAGDAAGVVTVTVPHVTFLYLDGAGRVTAVATNTGCAPRATDQVYEYLPGATGPVAATFDATGTVWASKVWTGDFTQIAVPQPQG
jgi:hypothetical protein